MVVAMASLSSAAPAVASIGLMAGGRRSGRLFSSVSVAKSPSSSRSSSLLHTSFLSSSSGALSFPSCFSGLSLGLDFGSSRAPAEKRRGLVVRAGKAALCLTKRSRSRKSLARTHGFRRRMRTTGGRAVLQRRRAKGRKILCPKSNHNSGKRA